MPFRGSRSAAGGLHFRRIYKVPNLEKIPFELRNLLDPPKNGRIFLLLASRKRFSIPGGDMSRGIPGTLRRRGDEYSGGAGFPLSRQEGESFPFRMQGSPVPPSPTIGQGSFFGHFIKSPTCAWPSHHWSRSFWFSSVSSCPTRR